MVMLRRRSKSVLAGAAFAAAALALGACEPTRELRGVLPDKETIAEIKPDQSRRDDVMRILGSPSAVATFDKETWYYVGERTESVAFFKPDVVEHKVLVVGFDEAGVVREVRQVDAMKEGQPVEVVSRETPTKGKEMTILQQLIGNVGRFNRSGEGAP